MNNAQERIQQEARRESDAFMASPGAEWATVPESFRAGFIAGRTVSAEMIEQIAVRLYLASDGGYPWIALADGERQAYRSWAGDLLTAAGLIVDH